MLWGSAAETSRNRIYQGVVRSTAVLSLWPRAKEMPDACRKRAKTTSSELIRYGQKEAEEQETGRIEYHATDKFNRKPYPSSVPSNTVAMPSNCQASARLTTACPPLSCIFGFSRGGHEADVWTGVIPFIPLLRGSLDCCFGIHCRWRGLDAELPWKPTGPVRPRNRKYRPPGFRSTGCQHQYRLHPAIRP